jgi:hypothetical protein
MTATRICLVGLACALVLVSAQARAEGTVLSLQGDVRDDSVPVVRGQRVLPGTTLTTGPGASAYLRFSDHQKVMLDERAARFVSGAIGARNPDAVAVRTQTATFNVRGTDFMVALADWTYLKVLKGAVSVTNSGGSLIVGEDTTAMVASESAIASPLFTAALPAAAGRTFSRLAAAPAAVELAQAPASATAGAAPGAATGAAPAPRIDVRAAARLGVYAALIAAALSSSSTTRH